MTLSSLNTERWTRHHGGFHHVRDSRSGTWAPSMVSGFLTQEPLAGRRAAAVEITIECGKSRALFALPENQEARRRRSRDRSILKTVLGPSTTLFIRFLRETNLRTEKGWRMPRRPIRH